MKDNIFRPISFWKSAFAVMPDNSFFELLRSVFGKIKTPFNKQQLLNDLEYFLLREDIQKTIAAYIDEDDAKIIAAIALFDEPAPERLENFFSCEYSYAHLQDMIVNLEERFIVYRFIDEKTNMHAGAKADLTRLALNPVLETVLLPFTADTSFLFPTVDKSKVDSGFSESDCRAVINDITVASLLSFASQWQPFYRTKDVIRKRVIDAGKTCFPGIDLAQFVGSMLVLGLFYVDDDLRLIPNKKHFDDFGRLSAQGRLEYCAAALLVYNEASPSDILPPFFRSNIRESVNFIHSFMDFINANMQTGNSLYTEDTITRIAEVIKAKTSAGIITKPLLEALEKTGLLTSVSPGIKQPCIASHNSADYEKPVVALDAGFSILVYPEINFNDAVKLTSFLKIRETSSPYMSPVVRFEMDKDSAVNAFDNNITSEEIIELLNRLSGKKADDAFIWNLKDWEKRHKEVSLNKGVILRLSEEHRYLTETKSFAKLISETLAPGLYLLDENAAEDAAAALRGAGIDIIARSKQKKESANPFNAAAFLSYYPQPSSLPFQTNDLPAGIRKTDSRAAKHGAQTKLAAALTADFQAILKKTELSDTEKAELSARIDRRLVLCETQLKEAALRFEKLEARNMDYAGKQNIAKQAISMKSPVEIVWLKQGVTGGEKIFGIPKALEKAGGEIILAVSTTSAGSVQEIRVPLAKISMLRRIKKSIFEK